MVGVSLIEGLLGVFGVMDTIDDGKSPNVGLSTEDPQLSTWSQLLHSGGVPEQSAGAPKLDEKQLPSTDCAPGLGGPTYLTVHPPSKSQL